MLILLNGVDINSNNVLLIYVISLNIHSYVFIHTNDLLLSPSLYYIVPVSAYPYPTILTLVLPLLGIRFGSNLILIGLMNVYNFLSLVKSMEFRVISTI